MTPIITGYQRAILDGVAPEIDWLLYSLAVSVLVLVLGFEVYRRSSWSFEEEL